MPRIPITDLGGSLNQGRAASEIQPNEYAAISNFYQFGSKLRRRGGMRAISLSATIGDAVTGLAYYKPRVLPRGGLDMVAASPTGLFALVGSALAAIPFQTGFSIAGSSRRWSMFQYKDILYGIRDKIGLVRSDGTYVGPGGIAAPTVGPTLADGGGGAIPAATFKGVYTFYNANTDMESNPSPVSNALVLGAGRKINWSGILTSSNVQVTSRRIYRTLPDQSGEYFLVAEIPNNVDTTYTGDNLLAQNLDVAVSQVNGTPPSGLLFGTVWKERLFVSDGRDLFYSEDGLIEAFDPDAIIPVFPDDGHEMRAVHAYGDRLVIGKTNRVDYLVGADPSTFALLTLTDRHGCTSHHSMQSAEGYLFWLGSDNVYRSDGNSVTGIASVKVRDVIEGMDQAAARDAFATVYPTLGWYMLVIPGYAQLIYNYRTDVWTTVPTARPINMIGDFFDADKAQQIYVGDVLGHIYRFHDTTYGYDDASLCLGGIGGGCGSNPTAISASFLGRALGAEAETKVLTERAGLLCARYAENIDLALLSEGTVLNTRTVSLDYEPRWKSYSLSTRQKAKALMQLRVTYTGATAIELEGWALDLEPTGRQAMMAR